MTAQVSFLIFLAVAISFVIVYSYRIASYLKLLTSGFVSVFDTYTNNETLKPEIRAVVGDIKLVAVYRFIFILALVLSIIAIVLIGFMVTSILSGNGPYGLSMHVLLSMLIAASITISSNGPSWVSTIEGIYSGHMVIIASLTFMKQITGDDNNDKNPFT